MTDYVVAGTGSRSLEIADPALPDLAAREIHRALRLLHFQHRDRLVVMSGCAEGFDYLLAWMALRLKMRLWCAVPNRGYGAHYWGRSSLTGRNRLAEFEGILARAWRVTHVMEDIHQARGLYLDGVHANFVRNTWMVGQADEFLVWDPTSKGTAHCLGKIRGAGLPYRVLSEQPATLM